jgi:glyoxylase-like metal-dependent hydrolase (beta-lactamase superfamily II)
MEFAYDRNQWSHHPNWVIHHQPVVDWYGFQAVPILETPEADFLFIPLPGHTRGHCGVAIGKPGSWLLHCGDAASPFHPGSDLHHRGRDAYLLKFIPNKIASRILGGHVGRLRSLIDSYGKEIQAVSAHDIFSFREYNQIQITE